MSREVHHVGWSAHVVECALFLQFVGHGHDVDRVLGHVERLYGLVNFLVSRLVERFGSQHLRYHGEGVLVDHERAEHHLLHVDRLRLQMSVGGVDGRRRALSAVGRGVICFWHGCLWCWADAARLFDRHATLLGW